MLANEEDIKCNVKEQTTNCSCSTAVYIKFLCLCTKQHSKCNSYFKLYL